MVQGAVMLKRKYAGERLHHFTVIRRLPSRTHHARVRVRCVCGAVKSVHYECLRSGATRSCGCQTRSKSRTHGQSRTTEYITWQQMRQRCENPKNDRYADYGGRGIRVCKRWARFANFIADMGRKPRGASLDRRNNDGDYKPSNCRWATAKQQANNRRPYRVRS